MLPGMRTFFGRQWSIKQEDPTGDSPLKTFGGKTSDCESVRGGGEGTGRPFFLGGGTSHSRSILSLEFSI